MSSLGSLVVSLSANTAQFTADLGKAAHEADKRMKDISDAAEKAGKLMAGAFVAAAASTAVLVRQAINSADAMGKLAQSTGVTVEVLSELSYAAQLSDVSTEELAQSLNRLNRNISDTAAGTGEAQKAFQALGIDVKDAGGNLKNADVVMSEVAAKFADMQDGAGKSALAMMLFGKAGGQLIPLLNAGADGLQNMRKEARDFGLTITRDAAGAAEEFNDNLTRLKKIQEGMANTIMNQVNPSLNAFTGYMIEAARESENFVTAGNLARVVFQTFTILGANVAFVLKGIGKEIGGISAQLAALARLDFKGALLIGDEMKRDAKAARADLDAFEARIMSIGQEAKKAAEQVKAIKAPAPQIENVTVTRDARKKAEDDARALLEYEQIAMDKQVALEEKGYLELEEIRKRAADKERELQEANDRWKEQRILAAQAGLATVREGLLTEEQAETESYIRRRQALLDANTMQLISIEEMNALWAALEADHMNNLKSIRGRGLTDLEKFTQSSFRSQATTITGMLADMTGTVAQYSREMFEINKVAGIANIALKIPEAIANSYAFGTKFGGPVLGAAMATIAGAAMGVQMLAIAKTSFGGGGGSAPSIAGSTPATPVTPVQSGAPGESRSQTTIIVPFTGTTDERKLIRRFVEMLNENTRDGGKLVLG